MTAEQATELLEAAGLIVSQEAGRLGIFARWNALKIDEDGSVNVDDLTDLLAQRGFHIDGTPMDEHLNG